MNVHSPTYVTIQIALDISYIYMLTVGQYYKQYLWLIARLIDPVKPGDLKVSMCNFWLPVYITIYTI